METAPDSRVFRPVSSLPIGAVSVSDDPTGGDVLFPVIVSAGDDAKELESSNESMERLTVQVVGLPTEAAESLKIEFEGVEFGLAPLPSAQQGGDARGNVLYWVDPDPGALPDILVVTQDSLPDGVNWTLPEDFFIGGGGDKRELLASTSHTV